MCGALLALEKNAKKEKIFYDTMLLDKRKLDDIFTPCFFITLRHHSVFSCSNGGETVAC